MNKLRLLLTLLVVSICSVHSAWADVEINETNFPDANFRSYLLEQSYGSDGVITDEEIAGITKINVNKKNIQSLKGIEFFINLEQLRAESNQLTAIDVSKNTLLTLLNLTTNQLTTLDISKNLTLTKVHVAKNQLTELDVSNQTALESVECQYNQLTTLVLSNNPNLNFLECYNNNIKGAAMDALITSMPLGSTSYRCRVLTTKPTEGNVITTTQVAAAKAKGWSPNIGIYQGEIEGSEFYDWKEYAGSEPTTEGIAINETNFPDANFRSYLLSQSYGSDGVITDAEIAEISYIVVKEKSIASLKGIEFFTALIYLDCSSNQLTTLDLSNNKELGGLNCSNNLLTTLNVEGCTLLGLKDLYDLAILNCFGNQIKDEGMDTFVESLPDNTNNCALQVIGIENEGNAMTAAQVAVARAKGWKPLAYDEEDNRWYSYLGSGVPVPEPVEINETNFPDPLFREYVSSKFDRNKDGKISFYEGQRGDMEPDGRAIMSLKGIEFFTEIEGLWCHGDQLTTLDLSKNTQLKEVECQNNQIRGKGMDELIENLPKTRNAKLYVIGLSEKSIFGNTYEGNVMTSKQVSAAIAKGWTPYHCIGRSETGREIWVAYEGNIATVIQPITEETTVTFGGNSGVDENTNLSNTVVEDVLYTLDTTTGDGYDNTDQSITIVSTMSDADIAEMEELIPGTPEFAEKFNGITLELAAGEGSVTFDCQTVGNRQLTVKIGNAPAATYTKSDRGEVKVAYNVAEPCFMYIYATATSASRGTEPTAVANALKLYGYTVKPGDTTGIEAVESISSNETTDDAQATWYDLNGRRVTTPTKGVYVKNGRKVVVK